MDGQDDFFRFTSQVMPQHVICWIYYVSRDFSFFRLRAATDSLIKGQLISKCLFGVFTFFQKANENKSTSSKGEFVHSFFGRNVILKKIFRICLTFSLQCNNFHIFCKNQFKCCFFCFGTIFYGFSTPLSPMSSSFSIPPL